MPSVDERSTSFLGLVGSGALSAKPIEQVKMLLLETITPNGKQPRTHFEEEKIQQLAATIKENGLVQPITVRERDKSLTVRLEDPKYEIVAGERRWKAFQYLHSQGLPGFNQIPAFVRLIADNNMGKLALIENLEREDLGLLETAQAFVALKQELGSADAVADVGLRSRSIVFKYLRIGEADSKAHQLIQKHDLDFKKSDLLISILDHAQKKNSPKQLEEELNSSPLTWDRLKALYAKYVEKVTSKTSSKKIVQVKRDSFWKSQNECGLSIRVKNSELTVHEKSELSQQIKSFLNYVGAKRVEIDF